MAMIEIFKTDVKSKQSKNQVLEAIRQQLPGVVATLDLDDKDKVLRVVGAWTEVTTLQIIELVKQQGFSCEILND
jgi:hypothetical protein